MKVYIAGPISNNPNYEADFAKAEADWKAKGHAVINPVKNLGFEYRDYIDMGLCELMKCDAIVMLNGWQYSSGAHLEFTYARTVGMKIYVEATREEEPDEKNHTKESAR